MTSLKLEEIITRPRQCAADWLVIQARDLGRLSKQDNNTTLLVFACLEARNAIEQLWYELAMVIYGGSMGHEIYEKCRRRRDGFLAEIGDAEPRYRQLSRFTTIVMDLDRRVPHRGIAWDLGRLKKHWHSLSAYCHAQAHPSPTLEDPKWVLRGHSLIEEVYLYFEQEMAQGATAIMQPDNMTPEARMIWEDFADNKIDEDQVRTRLRIVQPPPRQ